MGISVTDETLERATRVKRLIGRPQEALLCAARKRSFSGKCFICAKAKRQQQMLSVAKAKRQLQMFYLCESEAAATKRPVGTEINHTFW
ncbi:hypothetical protein [Lysinibacillus sp. G4S2]|uniref:hypothetical protein n=1 Tax=Lysinibacillus sp. G4S2 TaxID=3055859 RepID=UPI0025A0BD57|nr:hypothetical protein [Lysinibacillus sp. G4S2]MDM5247595.1 hypothetical protein [Lysinibacillus sp. G4S2]